MASEQAQLMPDLCEVCQDEPHQHEIPDKYDRPVKVCRGCGVELAMEYLDAAEEAS